MVYNGNIVEIRKAKKKTQTEVALYLNITQQQYSRYERKENEIPLRYIIKLCELYKISADEILGLAPGAHNGGQDKMGANQTEIKQPTKREL